MLVLLWASSVVAAEEWKAPPNKITILAVNAHPDDEGIFFGGALPYYSGVLQVPTMLLSMTSGDWLPQNLLIRENEMRNAAWIYGLRYEPLFPRFRDVPSHGMATNPYPNKIDATWDFWADGILQGDGSDVAAGKARAIHYVAEVIRRYRPEVIITHDVNGEYGHDNHKATSLAVTEAYHVAADPGATATNLAGLAPWQARKLYLHLYQTNQLFHSGWEEPRDELGGKTARQVANEGLDAHISQNSPDVSTFYLTGENYNGYDSERWGLFASTVGPDTIVSNGMAVGNFLENLDLTHAENRPPEFFPKPLRMVVALPSQTYTGQTLARFATDPDKVNGDILTFTKVNGPAWLVVSTNGALSGTPSSADTGENWFAVRVTDASGAFDEAPLRVVVGERLAAAWNFNEGTGLMATDSSGEEHHATLTAGATWQIGRERGAIGFNGTTGYAMSDNVYVANALTVAAWICPSNIVGERAIVSEGSSYILKTSGASLRFTTPGTRDHTYAAGFVTGQWYHVAVTFEAGATNGCRFYINGVFRGATNASARNLTVNATWIGRNQWGQYYAGLIDDVRIYRGVLNPTEIAALHANRPPVFTADPLLVPAAVEQTFYQGESLSARASDPDAGAVLTFSKQTGPAWLNVSRTGELSGTPAATDVGTNIFRMQVADVHKATAQAALRVIVAHQPTLVLQVFLDQAGGRRMSFFGERFQDYVLLGSSNLVNWSPVQTVRADDLGKALWVDSIDRDDVFFYRIEAD